MIDRDKQYTTADGREVRIYCVDGGGVCPVHGAIRCNEGWMAASWSIAGRCLGGSSTGLSGNDLIPVKSRRSGYIGIARGYPACATEAEAVAQAKQFLSGQHAPGVEIVAARIEWEE